MSSTGRRENKPTDEATDWGIGRRALFHTLGFRFEIRKRLNHTGGSHDQLAGGPRSPPIPPAAYVEKPRSPGGAFLFVR
jgi:hypothetical protein